MAAPHAPVANERAIASMPVPPNTADKDLSMKLYYLKGACSLASYISLCELGVKFEAASIDRARAAADVGADAVLAVVPYYNKPSQAGLAAHFLALAEHSPLPIVVYNVPSRTVADISVETLATIAKHPKIVAVKDATGNLGRVSAQRLACGDDFIQLSGNDDMALGFNAMGGVGCISVSANVAPKLCSEFQTAMREGRWDDALKLQDKLYPLHAALFTDASPGPTKYALSRIRNDFPRELRLPLVEASDTSKRAVDAALDHAGLT